MSSQISHYLNKSEQLKFLNNEKKLCRLLLHKKTFLEYQQHKKIPKGLQLKFQLALCCDDNNVKEQCNSILKSASLKIQKGIIKALNRNIFKLQKRKNILRNKMVDLLSDKQYKEIMTTIKKLKRKLTPLKTSYKKQNRRNFCETKYRIIKKLEKRIVDIHKKKEKQKSGKIRKKKELAEIKKN